MIDAIIPFLQFVGFCMGVVWLLTGASIWLRGGWTAVAFIWRRRFDIDEAIEKELKIRTH